MKVLREYKAPFDKIIGICSDGASTMQGVHKGVCTQLATFIRELRQVSIYDIIAADHSRTIDSFHKNRGCKLLLLLNTKLLLLRISSSDTISFSLYYWALKESLLFTVYAIGWLLYLPTPLRAQRVARRLYLMKLFP